MKNEAAGEGRRVHTEDFEFEGSTCRIVILDSPTGFWGHWTFRGRRESTREPYVSILDAVFHLRQDAEQKLKIHDV